MVRFLRSTGPRTGATDQRRQPIPELRVPGVLPRREGFLITDQSRCSAIEASVASLGQGAQNRTLDSAMASRAAVHRFRHPVLE